MRTPNVVYIMADDMGYGDVGCFNSDSKIPTPNMDRIASEGVRFTDAHSSSAVCTPSRYSVLTGRYCWRTRLKGGVQGGYGLPLIDPGRMTVAGLLKQRGYATAAVGKWHVGFEWQPAETGPGIDFNMWDDGGGVDFNKPIIGGPCDVGFDYFFGIAGSLDMAPYCFIENRQTVGIPSEPKKTYYAQQRQGPQTPDWDDTQVDVELRNKAVAWLEATHEESADQPFFLYLTPSNPHRPCVPPEFARGKSRAGLRGDCVWTVDWLVGEIDACLERLGVKDNTLIMVTSDNGARPADVDGDLHGHKSCGDLRGYKADIWEGGHRVPLVARWPHVAEGGRTVDATVCLMDLMATAAEITEQHLPDNAAEDSYSLLGLLSGESDGPSRPSLIHHSVCGMFALRDGDWKICCGLGSGGFSEPRSGQPVPGGPAGQLYNLDEDLGETTNQYAEHPERVESMLATVQTAKNTGRTRPARTD
ncbi:MAG: sulfatase-like hydrolase/transferase [Planctomycetes bacterium]|nr:arylsulfatase [Phycisphaerae bacterium]NBB95281.1 sulfatase-like hydrolase/transferase [Planctomycetota bacterium]